MKAIRAHTRGGPEVLVYEDTAPPVIATGDVLIRVHAAAVTPTEFTWNSTWTNSGGSDRLPIIPGFDVSGVVEKVAPDVADVKVGDAVYGLLNFWRDGAAAEYVAAKSSDMAAKPTTLDHIQAAAVPLSGLTAWQCLFDYAKLSAGERILIHGAAGGVGSWAVQLGHWRGAHVIATASQKNHTFLRELGADEVLDYTSVRFENKLRDLDAVLDTVGGDTLERSWGILKKDGALVTIVGDAPEEKAAKHNLRAFSILVQPDRDQLAQIAELIDQAKIRPIIDRVYPLPQARDAYEHGLQGHNRGKVVLDVRLGSF
jgi:NADPH:quinone reductase-like Zn-dependent oxidoreductase